MRKLIGLLAITVLLLCGCGNAQTAAPANEEPAPVVEKQWVVTNTWEGNGSKETEYFEVSKDTRINWEVDTDNSGFMLYLLNEEGTTDGTMYAEVREGAGKDTSYVHVEPGKYSLSINARGKYKITIEQQQQ